jgi:hypothetical protein
MNSIYKLITVARACKPDPGKRRITGALLNTELPLSKKHRPDIAQARGIAGLMLIEFRRHRAHRQGGVYIACN